MVKCYSAACGFAVVVAQLSHTKQHVSIPRWENQSLCDFPVKINSTVNLHSPARMLGTQTAITLLLKQPQDEGAICTFVSEWLLLVNHWESLPGSSAFFSNVFGVDFVFWVTLFCTEVIVLFHVRFSTLTFSELFYRWIANINCLRDLFCLEVDCRNLSCKTLFSP